MMFSYKILVSGNVQGVGFRYFTRQEADNLKLTGWVKNLPAGDVEILAEGEEEILDSFVNILKNKQKLAKVENLKISKTKILKKEFLDFTIVFD